MRLSLAGTVILALLGGLGVVTLAQADTDSAKVTHFTGTRVSAVDGTIDESWEADGIGHARGYHATETIEWSDPRLPSELQIVQNVDALGQGAVVTGATLLEGAEGYWTGGFTAYCDPDSDCHGMNTITGHGAYEGLSAVFHGFWAAGPGSDWVFDGVIYEGETLPMPEALEPTAVAAQEPEQASGSGNVITATSVWTSKGDEKAPLTHGNSVNLAPDGNLWVLDGSKGRFQLLSPEGAFIEAWGSRGTGEGEFDFVRPDGLSYGDVAFAPDGSFYVVESGNQRVQRFEADRQFVTMWGSRGEGDGEFLDPIGAAVAPDENVYVIDDERDLVQVFDPDGAFLFAFGDEASGDGQLNDPGFIDVAPDGTVYVADYGNHRVVRYGPGGEFMAEWGTQGDGPYAFNNPQGIAVGLDGLVYVGDFRNAQVKVFDADGQHLATWPDPAVDPQAWSISGPISIDVDDDGSVYVSEYFAAQVRKLATTASTSE
jgi:DNA-binding beta-propeller fold protein YncE